jgi:GDP/GTP exchange factor required for growth at low temperature
MSIRRTTTARASTCTTSSTDSLGVPLSPKSRAINTLVAPGPASPWQFDIVSIDDLDLSDTSSGHEILGPSVPPGLKKQGRKLPLRRDFEFVRRSESAASASLHVRDSVASHRTDSMTSTGSAELGGTIQPWQVNALIDSLSNDDEGGDVESALRRLEGQINPKKVQENKSKVDGWVRTIQQRLVAGDYSNEALKLDDEDENLDEDARKEGNGLEREDHDDREDTPSLSSSISQPEELTAPDHVEMATTPVATQLTHPIFVPTSPVRGSEPNAIPDDVASVELLHNMSSPRVTMIEPRIQSITSKFANSAVPATHRSFILGYRAQTLVEQLSIIDRDLFMGVKFEELFLGDWTFSEDMDVLDWTQFLKDRTQWKSESLWPHRTSALAAVRARFNLMANFTISEVVLTQPNERALVVGKFIRIAWVG